MWVRQSRCSRTQEILGVHDKNNRGNFLKSWARQVRFLLNTCLTVMTIIVQSGASRQEHQNKERHTMKQTTNSAAKKRQPAVQSPKKDSFSVSNRQSSKKITAYVWHTKNHSMNNVIAYVAPKTRQWRIEWAQTIGYLLWWEYPS